MCFTNDRGLRVKLACVKRLTPNTGSMYTLKVKTLKRQNDSQTEHIHVGKINLLINVIPIFVARINGVHVKIHKLKLVGHCPCVKVGEARVPVAPLPRIPRL